LPRPGGLRRFSSFLLPKTPTSWPPPEQVRRGSRTLPFRSRHHDVLDPLSPREFLQHGVPPASRDGAMDSGLRNRMNRALPFDSSRSPPTPILSRLAPSSYDRLPRKVPSLLADTFPGLAADDFFFDMVGGSSPPGVTGLEGERLLHSDGACFAFGPRLPFAARAFFLLLHVGPGGTSIRSPHIALFPEASPPFLLIAFLFGPISHGIAPPSFVIDRGDALPLSFRDGIHPWIGPPPASLSQTLPPLRQFIFTRPLVPRDPDCS